MEKVETKIIQTEDRRHHFYCDNCGRYLGNTVEHWDGYYAELGKFELQMYVPRGWYKLKKCFCNNCKDKFLDNVYASLETAGFKLD